MPQSTTSRIHREAHAKQCPWLGRIWILFVALGIFSPPVRAQIPGTKDIFQEFPEFTKEEDDERRDSLDFEYSRVVALALHGGYSALSGGLAQTMGNSGTFDLTFNYFMYTQNVIVLSAGVAFANLDVAGTQNYAGLDNKLYNNQPLKYVGTVNMYRFALGYRYYLGHPAYPNIFSFLGLNVELAGGMLLRFERYTIIQNGPQHPGLLHFGDTSPIVALTTGMEFPFLLEDLFFGLRVGYQLALLSDEGDRGFVGEARDGDWFLGNAYVMLHLE